MEEKTVVRGFITMGYIIGVLAFIGGLIKRFKELEIEGAEDYFFITAYILLMITLICAMIYLIELLYNQKYDIMKGY